MRIQGYAGSPLFAPAAAGRTLLPRGLTLIGVGCVLHAVIALVFATRLVFVASIGSQLNELNTVLGTFSATATEPLATDAALIVGVLLGLSAIALLATGLLRLTRARIAPAMLYCALGAVGATALTMFGYDAASGVAGLVGAAISAGLAYAIWNSGRRR